MNWRDAADSLLKRSAPAYLAIFAGAVGCLVTAVQLVRDDSPHLEIANPEQVVKPSSDGPPSVEASFLLRNLGRNLLVVNDVVSNQQCCARVLQKPDEIPPRGEGVVRVQVDASPFQRKDICFTLQTNERRNEGRILKVITVPAKEPPFFVFEPARIQLPSVWKFGACRELSFETAEKHGEPEWIESVTCDNPLIELAAVGKAEVKRELQGIVLRVYRYTVVLRQLPSPGRVDSQLVVRTRDREKSIRLSMEVVPAVKLAPAALYITDADKDRDQIVDLVARDDNAEVTARVGAAPNWIEIREGERPSKGTQRFVVRVSSDRANEVADAHVPFETTSPALGRLELRVCVRPSQSILE